MVRVVVFICTTLLSIASFAVPLSSCPVASAIDGPGFCSSFKVAGQFHCAAHLPKGMCTNMKSLYDRMTALYGSLARACESQHDTTTQKCIDAWNCYRLGGTTSQNELCSGTGSACE